MSSIRVPVLLKKESKTLTCTSIVHPVIVKTSSESMIRSVTTVPKALENDTPSWRFNMAQRANSPIRGITKLAA